MLVIPLLLTAAPMGPSAHKVAVVIDFGVGSSRGTKIACVSPTNGATGIDVLTAATDALRLGRPTQDASWPGFICSIGAYPNSSTSCVSNYSPHAGTWAYWHGTANKWSYSTYGAGTRPVANTVVEGWRFEAPGPHVGHLVAPRGPATVTDACAHQSSVDSIAAPSAASTSAMPTLVGLGITGALVASAAVVLRLRSRK